MSSAKIQGSVTGSGSVTLLVPATNSARVINLPDYDGLLLASASAGTAGQVLLSGGAGVATWQSTTGTGNVVQATSPTIATATLTSPTISSATITTSTLAAPVITGGKGTKVALAGTNIDVPTGDVFTKTISGTTTFTVTNVPAAGTVALFILELTNGGSATVNLWSGVTYAGGIPPTLTVSGRDVLVFYTHNGGTTWTCFFKLDVK